MHVALVGCGRMGTLHARTIARHPRCALAACVDIRPERAERVAAAHAGTVDVQVRAPVDAVIVATPTATHATVTRTLVPLGCWVLVEKPLGREPGEAWVHPRVLVGHTERFNPAVRAAGVRDPTRVLARRLAPWTGRSADTDAIADLMVHDLDLLHTWTTGLRVVAVDVHAWRGKHAEHLTATLEHDRGTAHLEASRVAASTERRIALHDARGEATLDLLAGRAWRGGELLDRPPGDALTAQLDALVDTVSGAPWVGATSAAGERAVQLVAAVRRMAVEQRCGG